MNSRTLALVFAFLATLIYGVSFTVAKEVMPQYVKPFGFIFLRVSGATILFWVVGAFLRKERIDMSDYPRLLLGAVFGIALNQLSFFKGLSMTTPISASVIMVSSPILVLSFSAVILREQVTKRKLSGIFIGMIGAVVLIVFGKDMGSSSNATLGEPFGVRQCHVVFPLPDPDQKPHPKIPADNPGQMALFIGAVHGHPFRNSGI